MLSLIFLITIDRQLWVRRTFHEKKFKIGDIRSQAYNNFFDEDGLKDMQAENTLMASVFSEIPRPHLKLEDWRRAYRGTGRISDYDDRNRLVWEQDFRNQWRLQSNLGDQNMRYIYSRMKLRYFSIEDMQKAYELGELYNGD